MKKEDKKIVYVDMDGVLCDYHGAYSDAIKINPKIEYPQSQHGFFSNLEPITGAIESMRWLLESKFFDVHILTAPSIHNPMSYTEKRVWVEKWLGFDMVKKLIITRNKALNKGDFLIDDNTEGNGQSKFEGELIHFGSESFPTWIEVSIFLNKLYEK
jgi:5'(3')-deoxyribonucleotidase